MTILDVNEMFGTDERCRELLKRLRWPEGVQCPRCKSREATHLATQKKFQCSECRYQYSVLSNTVFNDTHLPLTTWFLATLLLCEARKGMSANQLKRTLGVSYKTAWYMCHRIRHAMAEIEPPMMDGTIEIDETYIGGKQKGKGVLYGKNQKEPVIGIRQRSGDLRFFHVADTKSATVRKLIAENLGEDVDLVVTDESMIYPFALKGTSHTGKHRTIRHKDGVYVNGDIHTNTVESAFSLLKRGIIGSWHRVSAKHLFRYLDEMQFRFNRRKRSDLFLDTLRHMVTADPITFEKLTA